jgi:hypothetical protein
LNELNKNDCEMIIERTDNEILIRIPNTLNTEKAQQIIDYIRYQIATSGSLAKQEEVDEFAKEINSNWWKKNKDSFLK